MRYHDTKYHVPFPFPFSILPRRDLNIHYMTFLRSSQPDPKSSYLLDTFTLKCAVISDDSWLFVSTMELIKRMATIDHKSQS